MRAYKTSAGAWQLNFTEGGKQKTLYLGRCYDAVSANRIAKIITDIVTYRKRGESVPADILAKILELPQRVQQNIERIGLTTGMTVIPTMTYEQIMSLILEERKQMKETNRILQESIKKSEREWKEIRHWLKEIDQKIDDILEQFSDIIESHRDNIVLPPFCTSSYDGEHNKYEERLN